MCRSSPIGVNKQSPSRPRLRPRPGSGCGCGCGERVGEQSRLTSGKIVAVLRFPLAGTFHGRVQTFKCLLACLLLPFPPTSPPSPAPPPPDCQIYVRFAAVWPSLFLCFVSRWGCLCPLGTQWIILHTHNHNHNHIQDLLCCLRQSSPSSPHLFRQINLLWCRLWPCPCLSLRHSVAFEIY